MTPDEILARYVPGKALPLKVLDVLIELFNTLHTALEKTVSHKTRHERAQFLRRFFRDLKLKAGFKTMPDPRNLGQKHIRAMVQVWQRERLAPATIQTYLSFLRGLGMWMGKHGFVRPPAYYGLALDEYQRHESAQRDKSWSGQGIAVDALIAQVCAFDVHVGASLRLIQAMGLRRKECSSAPSSTSCPSAKRGCLRANSRRIGMRGSRAKAVECVGSRWTARPGWRRWRLRKAWSVAAMPTWATRCVICERTCGASTTCWRSSASRCASAAPPGTGCATRC